MDLDELALPVQGGFLGCKTGFLLLYVLSANVLKVKRNVPHSVFSFVSRHNNYLLF